MAYEELIRASQDVAIRTAAAFAPDRDADDAGTTFGDVPGGPYSGLLAVAPW